MITPEPVPVIIFTETDFAICSISAGDLAIAGLAKKTKAATEPRIRGYFIAFRVVVTESHSTTKGNILTHRAT
jgi:hypothetical protein